MVFFRAILLLLAYMKRPRAEGYVAVLEHSAEKMAKRRRRRRWRKQRQYTLHEIE